MIISFQLCMDAWHSTHMYAIIGIGSYAPLRRMGMSTNQIRTYSVTWLNCRPAHQ